MASRHGQDPNKPSAATFDASAMETDRPLDALLPGLRAPAAPAVPQAPVHQRVLEMAEDDGFSWNFALFGNPGTVRDLHKQVLALLEATMLAELSAAARHTAERGAVRQPRVVRLMVYPSLPWAAQPGLVAFGLQQVGWDAARHAEVNDAFRREAATARVSIGEVPAAVFEARVSVPEGSLGDKLAAIELGMAKRLGSAVWGETPGQHSHLFAAWAAQEFHEAIRPTRDGLRALEFLVAQREPGVIRWVHPLAFQSICDLIGVIAETEFAVRVAFSVCSEDRGGMAAPPVFRVEPKSGARYHVPIAHHVLRWLVMPLGPGEDPPSLADWMPDQFSESPR